MSARDAVRVLVGPRTDAARARRRHVVAQDPPAGTPLPQDPTATLWLSRRPAGHGERPAAMTRDDAPATGARGRGVARSDSRRPRSPRRVRGVAYDSRTVSARPGVRGAARASVPTAPRSRRRRSSAGAAAVVAEAPAAGAGGRALDRGARTRGSRWRGWRPSSSGTRAARCASSASPARTARRRPAYLLAAIFEAAGVRCGLMGTVEYRVGATAIPATRTTPEAPDVQAYLREMRGRAAAAPASWRCRRTRWRCDASTASASRPAVFTNLTRDHLDFHGGMEDYFAAKRRLFEMLPRGCAGARQPRRSARRVAAGRGGAARHLRRSPGRRDVTPGPLAFSLDGLTFDVRCAQGPVRVRSRLVGKAERLQHPRRRSAWPRELGVAARRPSSRGSSRCPACPAGSRWSRRPTTTSRWSWTTRTPTTRCATCSRRRARWPRRLITVFGAGGDRDRTKRPLMGMVAARLSDVVVITSDNPRSEDPARIIEEVMRGAEPEIRQRGVKVLTDVDRADAIRSAVREAVGRRSRADRRQGAREVAGDRRRRPSVRRRRHGARGAGRPARARERGLVDGRGPDGPRGSPHAVARRAARAARRPGR